jgi:hypothetical protein
MKKKLNECYDPNQSIERNVKDYLFSLTNYMIDKFKETIKPLPTVILLDNEEENFKKVLGRTGYYEPDTMQIIIYTKGRHPKDIIRSFAHEMIHHKQNIEKRLPDVIATENINEDDELASLEKEAYTEGNMVMREWENKIKKS